MENRELEMKMNEIINGNNNDDEMIDSQLEQLNSISPINSNITEEEINVPTVEEYQENKKETVTQLNGLAGKIQEVLGGESVMTPDIVQEQVVPTLPPDMIKSEPLIENNDKQLEIKSDSKTKDTPSKRGRAVKKEPDYDKLENELVNNFDSLNKEERYKLLLGLVNETSASLAKKLGFSPANRILLSVRGERNLNKEKLNIVYNYFTSNEIITSRPNVLKLITKEMFIK